MKTVHLTSPVDEEALRDLDAGDSVTISGRLFTCRSLTYDRLLDPEGGESVRTRLQELGAQTVFHSGPLVKEGPDHTEMIAMVPMPSWLAGREKIEKAVDLLGLKVIIGKGMLEGLAAFCKRSGCVHLVCAGNYNEYASHVVRVIDCCWPELGRPEAMWIVEVDGLGPLIVDADTKGKSLYQAIDEGFRSDAADAAGGVGYQAGLTAGISGGARAGLKPAPTRTLERPSCSAPIPPTYQSLPCETPPGRTGGGCSPSVPSWSTGSEVDMQSCTMVT